MNRGEWGEPYAALRLLGYKKLFMANENGDPNPNEWMDVLKIVRQETNDRIVTYYCHDKDSDIDIEINSVPVASIQAERLKA